MTVIFLSSFVFITVFLLKESKLNNPKRIIFISMIFVLIFGYVTKDIYLHLLFDDVWREFYTLSLFRPILNFVSSGKSLFGICLGLQLLFEQSEEFGTHEGLSLIRGKVKRFDFSNGNCHKYPVPQIGWNKIMPKNQSWKGTFLDNCDESTYMYFVHSFYVEPQDEAVILSTSVYGNQQYCSSIKKENIFATQFHPEKSGQKGLEIYRSFKNYLSKNV